MSRHDEDMKATCNGTEVGKQYPIAALYKLPGAYLEQARSYPRVLLDSPPVKIVKPGFLFFYFSFFP